MATAAEIQQIYQDVLGRGAQSAGLQYWLGTGDSIEKIRDDIARSDEAKDKVQDLYTELLGSDRVADFAGNDKNASWWTGEQGLGANEAGKGTLAEVRKNIMLSDEYKNLQSKTDDGTDDGTDDDATVNVDDVSANFQQLIDDALSKIQTVDTSNIIDSDSTSGIHSIATADVLADIKAAQGDIHSLQGKFAGLGDQTLGQVENIIDTKYGAQLKNLSSTYKADVTDLKSQIGDLGTKTTKQYLDLESALGKASDQFGTRLDDMQTDWQGKFKAGQASLGDKITAQGSAFDKRLRDLSASMNYKMLDDSATGVQTRRSQAFKSGKTSKGTGQLGRSLRLKSLNI
tara:strand:+ start:436 stop:1467 length:1032 start_codon:yes stop_codon:yes gene_type:complete